MGAFKGKNAKWLTMFVAICVVIVLTYVGFEKKQSEKALQAEEKAEISKIDNIILKDLEEEYPASVREVVKYYYKVLQAMFNGEATDKQIVKLIDKERALFDKELLKKNEYSEFVKGRNSEINQYKKSGVKLLKFVIQDSEETKYWQNNNSEMASIKAHIYMTGKKAYKDIYQEYVLRKDSDGRWKILSWSNTSDDDKETETDKNSSEDENSNTKEKN